MPVRTFRPARVAFLLVLAGCLVGLTLGCRLRGSVRGADRPVPLPPGAKPGDLIDRDNPVESKDPLDPKELAITAARVRKALKPEHPPDKKYNTLVLSGGGSYGAYSAGVLVGWTAAGTRPGVGKNPNFDVVTGISTGALIAPFAFLGPEYDCVVTREYTTVTNDDIFTRRRFLRGLLGESLADSAPLRRRLENLVTPDLVRRVAEEHGKGRRLYVGTTNMDTKRLIVWDLGAIANRAMTEDMVFYRKLAIDVVLASASIPAFFPPTRLDVDIDGQRYEELHVDGGVTRSMFFRPPYVEPAKREAFGPTALYDSNLYILVAGKIYEDPKAVRARTLPLALSAIGNLLYANTRGDLSILFNYCVLTGMNYYVSAMPEDLPIPDQATEFDPAQMTQMFNAGYYLAARGVRRKNEKGEDVIGPAWRDTPPGLEEGEEPRARTGLRLTVQPPPREPAGQKQPTTTKQAEKVPETAPGPRPVQR